MRSKGGNSDANEIGSVIGQDVTDKFPLQLVVVLSENINDNNGRTFITFK